MSAPFAGDDEVVIEGVGSIGRVEDLYDRATPLARLADVDRALAFLAALAGQP